MSKSGYFGGLGWPGSWIWTTPDLDSPAHFYDVIRFGGLEIWRGLDLDGSGSWMPRIDS